jgi:polyisoprenoid-binding protein YceI
MIPGKTAIRFIVRLLIPLVFVFGVGGVVGQAVPIDTVNSRLLVHVSKTGIFSGLADDHEVEARIAGGTLDAKNGQLRLAVDSRQMQVLDPQLSPDKRRQVQERMLGPEVLDSTRFPEIIFESTRVENGREGAVVVNGKLTLHGVTKPISLVAHFKDGRYTGTFTLRQRDFGIIPVSVAGGTVKVKDELALEFDITTSPGEK